MTKIMLIGGAGFIGSYCARRLLRENNEVIIFDNYSNLIQDPFKQNVEKQINIRFSGIKEKVVFVRGDIRYELEIINAIEEHKPEIIIDFAALTDTRTGNTQSQLAVDINLKGVINILEAIRKTQIPKRFVFISSSMVYGNIQYTPADEKHPTVPVDIYGATKLSSEIMTRLFAEKFGFEYVIVRPSAAYGPGSFSIRVSDIFLTNAVNKEKIIINNPAHTLDFTYVSDIAQAICLAAKVPKAAGETFNITYGEGRTLADFAAIVKKNIPDAQVVTKPVIDSKIPNRGALNISKAKKILGYSPENAIEVGIPKYIKGLKEGIIIE